MMTEDSSNTEDETPPSTIQIALSIVAAAFGVQTSANRKRDFSKGKPMVFIVGGLIFTFLLVLTLVTVVTLVLDS